MLLVIPPARLFLTGLRKPLLHATHLRPQRDDSPYIPDARRGGQPNTIVLEPLCRRTLRRNLSLYRDCVRWTLPAQVEVAADDRERGEVAMNLFCAILNGLLPIVAAAWHSWSGRRNNPLPHVASVAAMLGLATSALAGVNASFVGTFESIYFDDFQNNRIAHTYSVTDQATNRRFELHPSTAPDSSILTGDLVRVQGTLVGRIVENAAVTLYSGDAPAYSATAPSSSSTSITNSVVAPGAVGSQSTLVLLVNFQDNTSEPYTLGQAATAIFTDANAFVRENSYQQTSFSGDVVGWYTLPTTTTALQTSGSCDVQTIQTEANAAATAAGVNLAGYHRLVYLFPSLPFCGFAGASEVGGNPSHTYLNGDLTTHTVLHELGHALGLWHSHFLFCGSTIIGPLSTCTSVEYGDPSDDIGAITDYSAHFNAFQKERLGWLNFSTSPAITTATTSGTYSIQPFESAGSGPKAIKIFQSVDPASGMNTYFYLEARKGIGYDSYLTSWSDPACINYTTTCPGYFCAAGYHPCCAPQQYAQNLTSGVVVHLGTPTQGNTSYLLDMSGTATTWYGLGTDYALAVGQSFTDPMSGVTISTVSADSTGATVMLANVKAPPSSGTGAKGKK